MDYKLLIITKPLNVSGTKGRANYGATLTIPEYQTQTYEITAWMYGLQMLQLWIGEHLATQQKIRAMELDYLLGHHVKTMLRIGSDFIEPVDDDVSIDEK